MKCHLFYARFACNICAAFLVSSNLSKFLATFFCRKQRFVDRIKRTFATFESKSSGNFPPMICRECRCNIVSSCCRHSALFPPPPRSPITSHLLLPQQSAVNSLYVTVIVIFSVCFRSRFPPHQHCSFAVSLQGQTPLILIHSLKRKSGWGRGDLSKMRSEQRSEKGKLIGRKGTYEREGQIPLIGVSVLTFLTHAHTLELR